MTTTEHGLQSSLSDETKTPNKPFQRIARRGTPLPLNGGVRLREMSANQPARIIGYVLGLTTTGCSAYGLYYCYNSAKVAATGGFANFLREHDAPHFYPAFWVMFSVCVLWCLCLAWCGLDQLRLSLARFKLFVGLFVFAVIYIAFIGAVLWPSPTFGMSVGAASGVANGALVVPFFVLLPFWGPVAFHWSRKSLKQAEQEAALDAQKDSRQ